MPDTCKLTNMSNKIYHRSFLSNKIFKHLCKASGTRFKYPWNRKFLKLKKPFLLGVVCLSFIYLMLDIQYFETQNCLRKIPNILANRSCNCPLQNTQKTVIHTNSLNVPPNESTDKTLKKEMSCKCCEKSQISNSSQIPKLMDGDINMPDAMYHSVVLLKEIYKTKKISLSMMKCCNTSDSCQAFKILVKAFGKKLIDLDYYTYQLGILRKRLLAKSMRPDSCKGCFRYNFKTIAFPGNICAQTNVSIDLLFLITTVPGAIEARNALRDTWLLHSKNNTANVRYLFLIGGGWPNETLKKIEEENRLFKDILAEDYKDGYFNLSYKVLSGFRWAVKNCSNAMFVSRSADDIYNNIPNILNFIAKNKNKLKDTVLGTCWRSAIIDRNRWTRHYQSKYDFKKPRFGPFCVGKTLIMPMAATKKIVEVSANTPWFNLEDHWVGFAGEKAKLKIKNIAGFNVEYYPNENIKLYFDWRKKKGVCSFAKNWFNLHRTTPSDIRAVHKECIKGVN